FGHLKTVKDNLSKRFLSLFISSNPDSKDFLQHFFQSAKNTMHGASVQIESENTQGTSLFTAEETKWRTFSKRQTETFFTAGTTQRTEGSASLSIGERCRLYGIPM
ncbi:MAG: hypothetical protein M0Q12_11250, partial [Synergistaceae bacterium]|nr:hypothetical protein [Synergistaceae bacterium]